MKIRISYPMRTLIAFVIFLLTLFFLFSCGTHNVHWRMTNNRGIERYQYNARVFPIDHTCSTYDNGRQPIKSSTVRKLHFARKHRRQ